MSTTTPDAKADPAKALTADQVAKKVRRVVVETVPDGQDDDGRPKFKKITKRVAVKPEEVFDFKDYGTHVVVVTVDGQKLTDAEEA